MLRTYLSPEIQEEVEVCGDDAERMWARLDEKYGDESRLIDNIMADLKKFKRKAERDSDLTRLVEIVERAERDLKRLGKEHELNNTTIVSLIEEKLPEQELREWIKLVTGEERKTITANKFAYLLQFLSGIKRRIEYKQSDIRYSSSSSNSSDRSITGMAHHLENKYLEDGAKKPGSSSRCAMHSPSSHNTSECKAFSELPFNEKMKKAKERGLGFSCLKPSHRSVDCTSRVNCSVEGCARFHHKLLHPDENVEGETYTISQPTKATSCLLQLMEIQITAVKDAKLVTL